MEPHSTDAFVARLDAAFREARDTRGLSRRIAERCGVSEQAVGRWRKRGTVGREHLANLADELGVTTDWLLSGASPKYASDRNLCNRTAPVVADTVFGLDLHRLGLDPGDGDPVVRVGYRGPEVCYAIRCSDSRELAPRYKAGEVAIALATNNAVPGFDVFVQWFSENGVEATIRHLTWAHEGEVALEPVVPSANIGRRICLLEELAVCHPIGAVVAPWSVEYHQI